MISFRIDWFDFLAVQGSLKSLLQHHNLKASIVHCLAFFMVQFSLPYMITGKAIALTLWTFVSKVMSLLFNALSRFVIAFLPSSKRLSGGDGIPVQLFNILKDDAISVLHSVCQQICKTTSEVGS